MSTSLKSKLGWPLIVILVAIPGVLWATAYPLGEHFIGQNGQSTFRMSMTAIGQLLGILGMAMFALNFVLSARLKWIEGLFGGMNRVYIVHHILGGLAFVFLLFHPLFLALRYILLNSGFATAMHTLLLSSDISINFGIIALGLMQIFLIITFFIDIPYQIWKFTHKFLALAFFFASLHVLFIPSDVTAFLYLQWYMWCLVAAGGFSILYRTLIPFWMIPTREFIVTSVRNETPSTWEISLRPEGDKPFRFTAGQFLFISFPDIPELKEVHPFSISSSPTTLDVTLGIKAVGDFTKQLHLLCQGVRAIVEGPFGRTSYAYHSNKEQIWIAGGIGITPFLGMARSLKREDGYKIDLYYSLIDRNEQAFVSELSNISLRNPNIRFIPWFTKEAGYLSADAIVKLSNGVVGKEIFLCGPPPMMRSLKEQFKKWGIKATQMHSEEFSLT